MSQRRGSHLHRCPSCRINQQLCICHEIKPFLIETKISLIVHVRELKLTSNTAQFAKKMLPHNTKIFIRGKVDEPFVAEDVLTEKNVTPLYLYPHDDALEINPEFKKKYPGPYHLIIPDGNWQQAKKVRQREASFQNLKTVKIPHLINGEYKLRKAQHSHWLSTYEAMSHALGYLESPDIHDRLMTFFKLWVEQTIRARSGRFSRPI